MMTNGETGKTTPIPLPTSFPSFSWPTGVAHDTDLNIVTVVTKGGEGMLYRYDVRRGQWLDHRSLNNIDITSLTYSVQRKRYVAMTSEGAVMFISNQGEALSNERALPIPSATRLVATPTFGPPATPITKPQQTVLRLTPPQDLATGAEVVVVSGYEPAPGMTRVLVNRPGKRVLLILCSFDKVLWQVGASAGTTLSGIVLASAGGDSGVVADNPAKVYGAQLPFAHQADNVNFRELLQQLNAWFAVTKVDAFRGAYTLPPLVEISALDPARADLTLRGVASTAPSTVFGFELLTRDLRKVSVSNDGSSSVPQQSQALLAGSKSTVSGSGRQGYILTESGLQLMDVDSGQKSQLPLPSSFPPFSVGSALAYDVDSDIVTVVTLGGEGFLYRYDAKRKQWIDYRSLNNIDIASLAYDPVAKRYMAWTSYGAVMSFSSKGEPLGNKNLIKQLIGYGALYDVGNAPPPPLTIVPRGQQIALVHIHNSEVSRIWTYNENSGQVQLTYKRADESEKQKPVR